MNIDSKFLITMFNIANLLDDAHTASMEGDKCTVSGCIKEAEQELQDLKEFLETLGGNQ